MNYRFNLQPWRAVERERRKKSFITATVFVVLLVLAFVGVNYYIEKQYIEDQEETKRFLKTKTAELQTAKKSVEDTKLLIEEINKQIVAIEELQAKRGTALKLLAHLATETPETVFLNQLQFNGSELTVEGVAENDSEVANFMRALQASDLLNSATLRGIQEAQSGSRYEVPEGAEIKSFSVVISLDTIAQGGEDEAR